MAANSTTDGMQMCMGCSFLPLTNSRMGLQSHSQVLLGSQVGLGMRLGQTKVCIHHDQ